MAVHNYRMLRETPVCTAAEIPVSGKKKKPTRRGGKNARMLKKINGLQSVLTRIMEEKFDELRKEYEED